MIPTDQETGWPSDLVFTFWDKDRCIVILICTSAQLVLLHKVICRPHVSTINRHLQAYSLQVKSQDPVHTLGYQCVYISEIFKPYHFP